MHFLLFLLLSGRWPLLAGTPSTLPCSKIFFGRREQSRSKLQILACWISILYTMTAVPSVQIAPDRNSDRRARSAGVTVSVIPPRLYIHRCSGHQLWAR